MKRIYEDTTRREMKQMNLRVDGDTVELFKQLCKEHNTSMNQVLEDYMKECLKAAGKIK